MADQLGEQIHELQKKMIELACEIDDSTKGKQSLIAPPAINNKKNWRVLWVTAKHENHAFEIGYLERDGVEVTKANSTKEALEILKDQADSIDAIVTGVSRRENNIIKPQAGVDLLRKVKSEGFKTPVLVMCSEESIKEYYQKLKDEGAIEATSSSLDLLAFLKGAGINCSRQFKVNSNGASSNVTLPLPKIN